MGLEILTGGASAASTIERTPVSGDWRRPQSFSKKKAICETDEGISRMILVFTAPGSAAL